MLRQDIKMVETETIRQTLCELGDIHSTDKMKFSPTYARYLPETESVKMILEIGIYHGGSLRLWREWFPNSQVYGVDNNTEVPEGVMSHIKERERIHIIISDQTDKAKIDTALKGLQFDIIIDDGSHNPWTQKKTFDIFYPYVKSGGIYFVEDLPTATTLNDWWEIQGYLIPDFKGLYPSEDYKEQIGVFIKP